MAPEVDNFLGQVLGIIRLIIENGVLRNVAGHGLGPRGDHGQALGHVIKDLGAELQITERSVLVAGDADVRILHEASEALDLDGIEAFDVPADPKVLGQHEGPPRGHCRLPRAAT